MTKLRIGIIGAGTAGLATSIALARGGHSVQVFEKHPSLATLGAGVLIQPQGVMSLSDLGVGEEFTAASVAIERLIGICHRGWKLVDIPYRDVQARAISRSALANILFHAAQRRGVNVRFSAPVDDIAADAATATIKVGEEKLAFDILVIANGASSQLPTQIGLAIASKKYPWGALWGLFDLDDWHDAHLLQQRFATTRKMYGIMPTEWVGDKLRVSFFWSLPCGGYEQWRARPLDDWKRELLDLWPESLPVVNKIGSHDQLAFATYYHAHPSRLASPPICIVGDAAHAMSPQLGLGSTLAVQDALALSESVDRYGAMEGLRKYSKARLPAVRAYQTISRMLTPCFQADGNGLWRDLLFAAGLYVPGMKALMYRSIAAPRNGKRGYLEASCRFSFKD
jgi:2-polyprenyl-6-methoxyphenol hydroxylase-like FAD-dependent oxidoreductase